MMAALLTAVLVAVDPCQPVEPAGARDLDAAAAYRKVGDDERASGSPMTAATAYAAALSLDPDDRHSRAALHELCAAGTVSPDAFTEGLGKMDEGDLDGAIEAFRRARAAAPDASAALLEGICQYRLGNDAEAGVLLREAEGADEHREAARFYLGLLALRAGRSDAAASLFDDAGRSTALAPYAVDLARMARRDGRLVLTLALDAGWDSNATLTPDGLPLASDWSGTTSAGALFRPMGESGPYARVSGFVHHQLDVSALDLNDVSAAAGWQLGRTGRALVAEYSYDFRTLDGASYLFAHRLMASGWLAVGDVMMSASYFARFESYPSATYSPFDGVVQGGEVRSTVVLGPTVSLGAAYRLSYDGVSLSYLSWIEHGPRVEVRVHPLPSLRLAAEASLSFRPYRAVAPTFGAARSDTYLDGAAFAELDLASHWTVRLGGELRRALSNIPVYSYTSVFPTLGLVYVVGY